jgi:sterol desaturase/sphingolipid hydroxylase (fatty acid hydroxylase superfamily)
MIIGKRIFELAFAFVVLAVVFSAIEWLWPGQSQQRRLRRGFLTDVIYWFFTPLVTKTVSQAAVIAGVVPLLLIIGRPLDKSSIQAGFGPVTLLPVWAQVALVLLIGDFIGYWLHRGFHGRRLWKFHAVHHSSVDLDWLSSVRLHPINEVVASLCQAVPFVLLGFSPLIVSVYVPFLTLYALVLHANVSWTFGPLRYVLASPVFHRWHHTKEDQARDKNFAGLFPIWDLSFGTFYLPKVIRPTEFGVRDDSVPESFWGQLMYPVVSR